MIDVDQLSHPATAKYARCARFPLFEYQESKIEIVILRYDASFVSQSINQVIMR